MTKKVASNPHAPDGGNHPEANLTAPVPTKTRKPRKSKSTGPSWYRATLSEEVYRIIEADSPEQVAAAIVTVTSATPQDFVQAGKDGVALESKPLSGSATA